MSVATLVTADNKQHRLEIFRTESGWIFDEPRIVDEELVANGVNGRRFRTVYRQHEPFTATSIETFTSYLDAVDSARDYMRMVGTNVDLSMTMAGSVYSYYGTFAIHVRNVVPIVRPGTVIGDGITSANVAAHIIAQWDMVISGVRPDGA